MKTSLVIFSLTLTLTTAASVFPQGKYCTAEDCGELNNHFEGDILLTKEQKRMMFRLNRTGLVDVSYRWPNNTIAYEISTSFEQNRVDDIELALSRIEEATCVRFVKRTDEVNYVDVTADDDGCFSNLGYLNRGRQVVNLQPDSCFIIGTIIHEFLHTLGFLHMHSATERDNYVTIKWENIRPEIESNFEKYEADVVTQFGIEYDILSVMHYHAYSATSNGYATIVPHDISLIRQMGQRVGLSAKDIARINMMYNCDVL